VIAVREKENGEKVGRGGLSQSDAAAGVAAGSGSNDATAAAALHAEETALT